jgi:hypothetical protein
LKQIELILIEFAPGCIEQYFAGGSAVSGRITETAAQYSVGTGFGGLVLK